MIGTNRIRKLIPVVLSVCLSASAFFFNEDDGIRALAATDAGTEWKTNDLVKVQVPEQIVLDEVVVSGFRKWVLNGSNFNTDVSTGMHYKYLDDKEKILYRAMVAASRHVYPYGIGYQDVRVGDEGLVPLSLNEQSMFSIAQEKYQNAYEAARYDHPELAQLTLSYAHTIDRQVRYSSTGELVHNCYLYLTSSSSAYTQDKFNQMTNELKAKRTSILAESAITGAKGIVGRELAVHDKLIDMVTYDHACASAGAAEHISHTAYGALVKKSAVCDGYAQALSYLLSGINVDSMVIAGDAGGGHAWNIVKQGGDWYEVDATWDDPDTLQYDTEEYVREVRHIYYHLTTDEITNFHYEKTVGGINIKRNSRRVRDGFSLLSPSATGTTLNWENVKAAIAGYADITTPVTGVSLPSGAITGNVGSTGHIEATVAPADATNSAVHWKSSDEDVITIDEHGDYEVTGSGHAVITVVTDDGGFTASLDADIPTQGSAIRVSSISVTPSVIEGKIGDFGYIEYIVAPNNAENQNVTFEVSDESVATVSRRYGSTLAYTIVGNGSCTVKVKTEDGGFEATCLIKGPKRQFRVTYDANGGTINGQATYEKNYEEGSSIKLWDVSNPVRDGYTFDGWFDDATNGNSINGHIVSGEMTVYAHWTKVATDSADNQNGSNQGSGSDSGSDNQQDRSTDQQNENDQTKDDSQDDSNAKPSDDSNQKNGSLKAKITPDKKTVKFSKVKKKDQKVTIKVSGSKGKITAKNVTAKKLKKYLKVKVNGRKVICTMKKGAPKGTYKVKVTVAQKGNYKKTVKTIKITVK